MDTRMDERFPWEYGSTVVQYSLLVSRRYHIISLDFLRFEQECVFVLRDGVRERESYQNYVECKADQACHSCVE